ncbi:MAG TPA: retroviral-like aspartic protease family protein [Rhizomicrobium sp.]
MIRVSANVAVSLLFAAELAGFSKSAAAQQCTLKLMATLPITDESGGFTVPVSINGEAHQFLVDTGGVYSSLSEAIARRQQLKEVSISGTDIFDAKGERLGKGVSVDSLKLGNNEAKHFHMLAGDSLAHEVDGIIAPDLLQVFDVELDFAARTMDLFSPDHCPGKVVHWTKEYADIPFKMPDGYHIIVPVTLDGHTLMAQLDTGASTTVLSQRTAQELFNAGPNSSGTERREGAHAGDLLQYQHRFQSLSFGGVSVTNPLIALLPDDMEKAIRKKYDAKSANDPVYGLQLDLPRLTIGDDVIKRLHIYIAYKEQVMYVTPADAH